MLVSCFQKRIPGLMHKYASCRTYPLWCHSRPLDETKYNGESNPKSTRRRGVTFRYTLYHTIPNISFSIWSSCYWSHTVVNVCQPWSHVLNAGGFYYIFQVVLGLWIGEEKNNKKNIKHSIRNIRSPKDVVSNCILSNNCNNVLVIDLCFFLQ